VVISVMAVIGFADGWSDIVQFAKDREQWLRTVLELPSGIPSDDTFRRVMSALDPATTHTGRPSPPERCEGLGKASRALRLQAHARRSISRV
jgi:hypothetical protein